MGKLSLTQRRLLLTLHLLFAAIMLGVSVVFLILSITAAATNDEGLLKACFAIMHKLADTSLRISTIATLATGVLLSALTQWGFFKFYWIIVKEGLTLLSVVLGPIGMHFWTLKAVTLTSAEGARALQDPAFNVNGSQLWIGIIVQIVSLAAMFAISVFKPWGSRKQNNRSNLA